MTRLLLIFVTCLLAVSCAPRYAILAISTIDAKTNQPLYARVYSGRDANYIGDTPALNYLVTRKSLDKSRTICLIAEADDYKTKWQMIQVLKWSKTAIAARDATMLNRVLLIMPPVNSLTTKESK